MPIIDLPVKGHTRLDTAVDAIRVSTGSVLVTHPDIDPYVIEEGVSFDAEGRAGLRLAAEEGAGLVVAYVDHAPSDYSREDILGEEA